MKRQVLTQQLWGGAESLVSTKIRVRLTLLLHALACDLQGEEHGLWCYVDKAF